MAKILAIRFSALGDVAMAVPVFYSFAKAYPQHQLVVLSRSAMAPLFAYAPSNLLFKGVDLKKDHKGLKGILSLYSELRKEKFDAVADLHDVLRSKVLRLCFCADGVRVRHINKGRRAKYRLVSGKFKTPLKSSFCRYLETFEHLGYPFTLRFSSIFEFAPAPELLEDWIGEKGEDKWIGIAPFAAHKGKIYPLSLHREVVGRLSAIGGMRMFLFGGGDEEKKVLDAWEKEFPHVTSVVGRLRMQEELALMSKLDVMLAMDSGNMHLASLVGVPVVSVWGATHPYAGFMGWNQAEENVVQLDLPCRPCSIYGNKPCRWGDYRCLTGIRPEVIVGRIRVLTE